MPSASRIITALSSDRKALDEWRDALLATGGLSPREEQYYSSTSEALQSRLMELGRWKHQPAVGAPSLAMEPSQWKDYQESVASMPPPPGEQYGPISDLALQGVSPFASFVQGATGIAASIPESLGIVQGAVTGTPADQTWRHEVGQGVRRFVGERVPEQQPAWAEQFPGELGSTMDKEQSFFGSTVPRGMGSTAAFLAGGEAGLAAKLGAATVPAALGVMSGVAEGYNRAADADAPGHGGPGTEGPLGPDDSGGSLCDSSVYRQRQNNRFRSGNH